MARGGKIILNRNKNRKVSYKDKGSDDSDDDDYVLEEDEESKGSEELCASADDNTSEEGSDFRAVGNSPDFEDEVEKKKVGRLRGSKSKEDSWGTKRTRVKRTSVSDTEEEYHVDDDDDDYVGDDDYVDNDDNGDEENEVEKRKVVRSRGLKSKEKSVDTKGTRVRGTSKRTSVSDDEEEYCFDDDDDEPEKVGKQKVLRSRGLRSKENSLNIRKTRLRQSNKTANVSDEEEEYRFDDDTDGEQEEVEKPMIVRSRSSRSDENPVDRKGASVSQRRKRSRVSDDEEEYCLDEDDDDDDDDEEDEEFAPDGVDSLDEEEFEVKKKINKVTKHLSRKKTSRKSRKRKSKSKVSKKPLKRERGILGVRKATDSCDEDFVDTVSVVREKRRIESRKKNKRIVTDWDSDSACSEPSNLEYTISEEEKESLKEAIKFCGNLKASLRNSSPPKRLHLERASKSRQQRPIEGKGKATINDLQNDTGKQVCGICLSEEGNGVIRGTLNCCSHYFCFACIMEWSKVESRCPLCKQRFERITRSPRSDVGIDLRNSVIQVPMRDQVYRPSEEEVRGYFDPYENVICMECHQGGDDNLMLLCDICDSPAHTYCVGLDREVPVGNWYCEGCMMTEGSSSNSQFRDPVAVHEGSGMSTQRISSEDLVPPSQYSPLSIPQPLFTHGFGSLNSPRYPTRDVHNVSPSGTGVSTLLGRRRIHRQVHDRVSSYRETQVSETVPGPASISHIDLNVNFVPEQCEEEETIARNAGTSLSNVFSTSIDDSVEDTQDRQPLSERLSHLRQVVSRETIERTNTLSGSEQFNQCGIKSDDCISPHTYRDNNCFHGESAK